MSQSGQWLAHSEVSNERHSIKEPARVSQRMTSTIKRTKCKTKEDVMASMVDRETGLSLGKLPEQMGYKSMNPAIYYSMTMVLYVLEIFLSIIIKDISQVFGFIGAIAGTSLSFFIPSILFSVGYSKFASERKKRKYRWLNIAAWLNFIAGLGFFAFFLYADIIGLR